jgi:hypothetical protein
MDISSRLGQLGGAFESPLGWNSAMLNAVSVAHGAGKRLAEGRRWVETEAMEQRPLTTLGVAFAVGVLTGWLIKRR